MLANTWRVVLDVLAHLGRGRVLQPRPQARDHLVERAAGRARRGSRGAAGCRRPCRGSTANEMPTMRARIASSESVSVSSADSSARLQPGDPGVELLEREDRVVLACGRATPAPAAGGDAAPSSSNRPRLVPTGAGAAALPRGAAAGARSPRASCGSRSAGRTRAGARGRAGAAPARRAPASSRTCGAMSWSVTTVTSLRPIGSQSSACAQVLADRALHRVRRRRSRRPASRAPAAT